MGGKDHKLYKQDQVKHQQASVQLRFGSPSD